MARSPFSGPFATANVWPAHWAIFLSRSLARAIGGGETIAQAGILYLSAAILGVAITVSRYRIAV